MEMGTRTSTNQAQCTGMKHSEKLILHLGKPIRLPESNKIKQTQRGKKNQAHAQKVTISVHVSENNLKRHCGRKEKNK